MGIRLGCIWCRFMVCLAFASMALVLVVDGTADTEEDGSGFDPRWQLLTRKNFSTQIRQHEFALLMVTYPWSGESRALRNDLVQLMKYMHAQFQRLRLMLIYRNVEKLLGDVLVGDKAVNLVLYREAVPFKYSGKLSAQTILASVWHAMSIPSGDLPFKQLNTLEDLEFFLQSTDKVVLLFDICGWVPKILAADNKNTRFSTTTKTNHANLNQEEGLERDGSVAKKSTVGSQLKPKSDNTIESVGMNVVGDKNTKTSLKSALMMTENHGFVSEQEICETNEGSSATLSKDGLHRASYGNDTVGTETNTTGVTNWQGTDHSSSHAFFHGSSCTQEEYNYFKVLYTNLSRIARDNMLPPERQRFGLLSNRTVISVLSTDVQQKSSLMLQFPDCPNCSKTFDRGNDLEEFVLTPHPLVTELQGEGYKLVPPLSTETASLILFIDRTSPSKRLRQRSKAALQEVRQVAFHYLNSALSDKRKIIGGDESLPKTYSSRKARKKAFSPLSKHVQLQVQSSELLKWLNSEENKGFQFKAAERGIQIVHRKIDGSLVSSPDQFLNYFIKQKNSESQLNQDKLAQLAKKAGLQLLSGEFPIDTVQVSHIPETISSLIEKTNGQTEEDFKKSVRINSLETEEQYKKLGDIVDNIHTHSLTSKHIADNGNKKQDFGIVLNDVILDPEGYDIKHEHSTTQECPARPWQEHCKNELSKNECPDNNSNQGCKIERIEDSGDQVTYLKESVNQEYVAEEYVSQKLDVYDKKRILPESGNGEQNQDITIPYAEEKALFEKKGEGFDKLDDQQDQNYGTGISFLYSEGGDQLRTILSSGASIPSVVLIDPVKQSHYLFPKDIPITYSSLLDFINSFLNETVKAYKLSEAFPPSPREPPRPPFVNRDFHEVDSIPRVTVGTFSRLVIGLEGCNETIETSCAGSHHPGAAWGKDVLVLFSNDWCGFCKRSELVVREVHRFFEHCRNSMHVEGEIAPNSSVRDMSSLSTEINREKFTVDVSKDEVTKGDHLKYEPNNGFPSVFQIDCTLNDCTSLLKSLNQKQKGLYPALLLFPAEKKDDPIAYEGDISVNEVIEFLASYGSVSSHLYSLRGVLWNKMQQGGGSLNTCAPWTLSSIPIQIEAPLHMQRTGHEHLPPISEQYGSNQYHESNGRLSLQRAIQNPTVGSVLVASEKLQGVYPFENSIIIIVKADFNEGFQGLIVNKPLSWDDLPKIYMQLEPLLRPSPIYLGGPIIFKGMPYLSLTHIVDLEGFLEVLPGIYYGDPKVTEKIFMMIKAGKVQAHDFSFFLGFTNWGWQQLFDEVAEQAWHLDTYREDIVRWSVQK